MLILILSHIGSMTNIFIKKLGKTLPTSCQIGISFLSVLLFLKYSKIFMYHFLYKAKFQVFA